MIDTLTNELKRHAPYTILGAATGILLLAVLQTVSWDISYQAFYILHPAHVFLSGMVTASLYRLRRGKPAGKRRRLGATLVVGYIGAIGVATLSDSLIPYLGEWLLDLPNRGAHIGFIEKWWLVNPLALAGIVVAFLRPRTKLPHAGHVLLSTYASLFHVMMALGEEVGVLQYIGILVFLLLAVWLPAALSDIGFPVVVAAVPDQQDDRAAI